VGPNIPVEKRCTGGAPDCTEPDCVVEALPPGESSKRSRGGAQASSLALGEGVPEVPDTVRLPFAEPDPAPEMSLTSCPPETGEKPVLPELHRPAVSLFCRWKAMMLAMSTSRTLGRTWDQAAEGEAQSDIFNHL